MGIPKRKSVGVKSEVEFNRREFFRRTVRKTLEAAAFVGVGILISRNADKIGHSIKATWGKFKKLEKPLPPESIIEEYLEMRKKSERKAAQEQERVQATKAQSAAITKRIAEIEKKLYPEFFKQEKEALEGQVKAMYGSNYKLTSEQIKDLSTIARQNARTQAGILAEKEIHGN